MDFSPPPFESVEIKLRGMDEQTAPHTSLNFGFLIRNPTCRPRLSGLSPEEANVLRLSYYLLRRYFL